MSNFFFQAEDGIRDLTVTGVQTCALPICYTSGQSRIGGTLMQDQTSARTPRNLDQAVVRFAGDSGDGMQLTGTEFTREARSEERRVGKEWRCRGSPAH